MKNAYIAVVSHNHSEIIKEIDCLRKLSKEFNVIVKSNTDEDIYDYCSNNNIEHLTFPYGKGFGENNNIIFEHCINKLDMTDDDYFIILNPDVDIDVMSIKRLLNEMAEERRDFSTINLFKDKNKTVYDNSVRTFPTIGNFILSFLGFKNKSILDKSVMTETSPVDWAAGSFLAFKSDVYSKVKGFDISYFMYCEDIDICYRARLEGHKLYYFPHIHALHLAQHKNRNVFSKHFIWHVKSVLRFLLKKQKNKQ